MSDLLVKIGPYQILKKLGAGGMGEVFLAYDDRLDRQVAIKRIRSDKGASSERQERFRREARLAAKLNHPTIVHVYDVLTEGDVNFIVMEHVEGTNLRRLLDDGPLPVGEAAAIGRDVAEGLAEAHDQGIVHRDLKSENVLVTPSGHAKITDFGIAKRLLRGEDEESLTAQGHVLGTYRAMSPEQARGEKVDHRSDLFSLGVLLYEALTGKSPFEAENELAMLNRIVHHRQISVHKVNPEVPENLSSLIDHLLEKDPRLRPRNAGEAVNVLRDVASHEQEGGTATSAGVHTLVKPSKETTGPKGWATEILGTRSRRQTLIWLGLFVIVSSAAVYYLTLRSRPEAPVYVAVLKPKVVNRTGIDEIGLLALDVRVALLRGLLAREGISPKNFDEVDAISGPVPSIARAVAADEVIESTLDCGSEVCQVLLQRLQGRDGIILWAESFEVPTDDFYMTANAVASQIGRGFENHPPRKGMPDFTVDSQGLKTFLDLRRRFDNREALDPILQGLVALREKSPRFLDAYLLEADVARYKFHDAREPEDLRRAFDLIRTARALAPNDPQPLFTLFDVALAGRDLTQAQTALAELEQLAPGDARVLDRRARLLRDQGRTQEALVLLRSAAERHPSWKRLSTLARMEYQHGESDAARRHLEELLRRAPDNIDGLSLLAEVELTSGDLVRATVLFERLSRLSPDPSKLTNLGLVYLLTGRYSKAVTACQRALEKAPQNPFFTLNLADSHLLAGHKEKASRLYQQVLDLMAADPMAQSPQALSVKAQSLAHLGQNQQAIAAIHDALLLAPEDGAIAYEAALVYALLGETESALLQAKTAVQQGFQPLWFILPWFDSLRSRSEFSSLLTPVPRPN